MNACAPGCPVAPPSVLLQAQVATAARGPVRSCAESCRAQHSAYCLEKQSFDQIQSSPMGTVSPFTLEGLPCVQRRKLIVESTPLSRPNPPRARRAETKGTLALFCFLLSVFSRKLILMVINRMWASGRSLSTRGVTTMNENHRK